MKSEAIHNVSQHAVVHSSHDPTLLGAFLVMFAIVLFTVMLIGACLLSYKHELSNK